MSGDIRGYLNEQSFDAETTQVMGQAYDRARRMLHDRGQPELVLELIAKRIIAIASTGERKPDELARRALQALGLDITRA